MKQFFGKIALVMTVSLLVFIDQAIAQGVGVGVTGPSGNNWRQNFREAHEYVNNYMLGYNLAPKLLQQAMEDENNRAAQAQKARNDALGFVQTGVACLDKKDWNGAISNFTKAANADPSFDMPFKGRSIAYSQKGDYDKALSDCDQALRLNATDAEVRALLVLFILIKVNIARLLPSIPMPSGLAQKTRKCILPVGIFIAKQGITAMAALIL